VSGHEARPKAMPRHFLEVKGASVVKTPYLNLTRRTVREVESSRAMGAIIGDAGLGKTFAVEYAISKVAETPTCWTRFALGTTPKQLTIGLLKHMTGLVHTGVRSQLDQILMDLLRDEERLITVDEAQWLDGNCFEHLRYFHDDAETRFALLLVGGHGCEEVIARSPMLDSRVYARARFRPLTLEQVLKFMPEYHAIYRDRSQEVEFIDEHFAHGNLRDWAKFTKSALGLLEDVGRKRIDEDIAQNVFVLLGGESDDLAG
jgi:DNA transposition AAA+ family ATPase